MMRLVHSALPLCSFLSPVQLPALHLIAAAVLSGDELVFPAVVLFTRRIVSGPPCRPVQAASRPTLPAASDAAYRPEPSSPKAQKCARAATGIMRLQL